MTLSVAVFVEIPVCAFGKSFSGKPPLYVSVIVPVGQGTAFASHGSFDELVTSTRMIYGTVVEPYNSGVGTGVSHSPSAES
jgi:hypothetical protein